MQTVTVTPGKVHQTKYGALPHSDMIGRQFGTKVCYTLSLTNVALFLALEQQANASLMFLSHIWAMVNHNTCISVTALYKWL